MPTRHELERALASARLLRGVAPEVACGLAPDATIVYLRQGEQLWHQGAIAEHFYVVLRGVLELRRRAPSGEATLLAFFGPGESPAVPVALEQEPFVADSFATTKETIVLRVRARAMHDALSRHPPLVAAMNRALLAHCRLIHAKVNVLSAGAVPQRLAALFLDLADRFGDEGVDGGHHVPLALSRGQLATYIGARVETVIRCCSGWQKRGFLETDREGFVLGDLEALRRVLRGAHMHHSNEGQCHELV